MEGSSYFDFRDFSFCFHMQKFFKRAHFVFEVEWICEHFPTGVKINPSSDRHRSFLTAQKERDWFSKHGNNWLIYTCALTGSPEANSTEQQFIVQTLAQMEKNSINWLPLTRAPLQRLQLFNNELSKPKEKVITRITSISFCRQLNLHQDHFCNACNCDLNSLRYTCLQLHNHSLEIHQTALY